MTIVRKLLSACCLASGLAAAAVPAPYVLDATEVRDVHARALNRDYQVFVALPDSYRSSNRRYPVLFVTDANYAFPVARGIAQRLAKHAGMEEAIVVGLSYAKGDSPVYSRRRDYTPSMPRGEFVSDMPGRSAAFGEAQAAYAHFIEAEVFPVIAAHYRVDMQRKIFAGHSFGGLLGAQILLSKPSMFEQYILSSPSLWFDDKVMLARERAYSAAHTDMRADVFLSIGAFETVNPLSGNKRYHRNNDMVRDLLTFEAQLRSRRYPSLRIEATVIDDEDHLTVYPAAITRGLMWALPAAGH